MASEPFFEEQSDVVKMSETPYPTNGSGKNLAKNVSVKCSDLCTHPCPYRLAGLGTSLRVRGKLTTKEERNYSFYMSKPSKYGNSTQKVVFVPAYIFHFYRGRAIKKAPLGRLFIISFTRIYISR